MNGTKTFSYSTSVEHDPLLETFMPDSILPDYSPPSYMGHPPFESERS